MLVRTTYSRKVKPYFNIKSLCIKLIKTVFTFRLYSTFIIRVGVALSQYNVWLRAGRPGDGGSIPVRGERIFPLVSVSRLALGPTQPPVKKVMGAFSRGLSAAKA
jgi:hypothetical protein